MNGRFSTMWYIVFPGIDSYWGRQSAISKQKNKVKMNIDMSLYQLIQVNPKMKAKQDTLNTLSLSHGT